MTIQFSKYQGTGNDFIIIDDRAKLFPTDNKTLVNRLCQRRFGIGADGLILLRKHEKHDFQMIYFNADGAESSLCGNGGRCLTKFAKSLGLIAEKTEFLAVDGIHHASIHENGDVALQMHTPGRIDHNNLHYVLDTGSPHYVQFVGNVGDFPLLDEAKKIRFNEIYKTEGINVNFVEKAGESEIRIRTYERGVEDETFSCGTGAVAAALAWHKDEQPGDGSFEVKLQTEGGKLKVSFDVKDGTYSDIHLIGPATKVYEGLIEV